jgi:hypothetical protein
MMQKPGIYPIPKKKKDPSMLTFTTKYASKGTYSHKKVMNNWTELVDIIKQLEKCKENMPPIVD